MSGQVKFVQVKSGWDRSSWKHKIFAQNADPLNTLTWDCSNVRMETYTLKGLPPPPYGPSKEVHPDDFF